MIALDLLLADHELYHSDFQMDSLITVRAGGTLYGCYKQALRELWKRCRGLRELYARESLLRIDLDELASSVEVDSFELRRRHVQRWEKTFLLAELGKNIEETEREFTRFYAQAIAIKQVIGHIDSARRSILDQEMWEHRLKCAAAVELMSTGKLSAGTIDAIRACPQPIRERLIVDVFDRRRHDQLLNWFMAQRVEIPNLPTAIDVNVRGLLQCSA